MSATTIKLHGTVDVKKKIILAGSSSSGGGSSSGGSGGGSSGSGGTLGLLQAKTVYPTNSEQKVIPDIGFYGLSAVTVKPIPQSTTGQHIETHSEVFEGMIPLDGYIVSSDTRVNGISEVSTAYHNAVEEPTAVEYKTHIEGWYFTTGIVTADKDYVVYSFPVKMPNKYIITMSEIGNVLRVGFVKVDPETILENIDAGKGVTVYNYLNLDDSLAIGYEFEYTAILDGWCLLYVSNLGVGPNISVEELQGIFTELG